MKEVYLVEGRRTPQAKSGTSLKDVDAPYLGHYLVREMMDNNNLPYDSIDEVIVGNTGTPAEFPNIGRVIGLMAGLDKKTSGYSVHRNCASGMEAMSQAYLKIASGRSDLIFAGGVENMTKMPLIFSKEMTDLFMELMKAKTPKDRMKTFTSFRLPFLKPIISIEKGLTDPFCGLNMGQTAEILAREFQISRLEQDEFSLKSHQKAVHATKEGLFTDEIIPIVVGEKTNDLLSHDVGPRENSSLESLAKLKPYFEKGTGTVTVGNACPITDGGSMWLFASEEAVKKYNLKPMARMIDYSFTGLEPERMGLGPALSMHSVLKRANMTMDQMDLIEINEAFAAQVLSCIKVMKDKTLSSRWGIDEVIGEVPMEKLNVHGGAIALGHPVGSTGSRLVVTLAHALRQQKKKYGIASLCIGGGQGGAVIIENLEL